MAVLTRVLGDIDVAEDAVQDAFVLAVRHWPSTGFPPSPAGWIITTARNRGTDAAAVGWTHDGGNRPRLPGPTCRGAAPA
ncbi:MAG: sigma factor [Arthrobacter sp.]